MFCIDISAEYRVRSMCRNLSGKTFSKLHSHFERESLHVEPSCGLNVLGYILNMRVLLTHCARN